MSSLIRYVLVSLCSFAVASPPALCCQIDLSSWCAAPAKEQEQKAKPKCSHCCSDEPAPTLPGKAAKAPKPTAPMPECCGDRQPATPVTSPSPLPHPDLLVGIHPLVDTTCPAGVGNGNAAWQEPIVFSLSAHVRNCIWLC